MSSLYKRSYEDEEDDSSDLDGLDGDSDVNESTKIHKRLRIEEPTVNLIMNEDETIYTAEDFCHYAGGCDAMSESLNHYCNLHQPEYRDVMTIGNDLVAHVMRCTRELHTIMDNTMAITIPADRIAGVVTFLNCLVTIRWMVKLYCKFGHMVAYKLREFESCRQLNIPYYRSVIFPNGYRVDEDVLFGV